MKKVLFLNHKQQQCGVYQYGYRSAQILKDSQQYDITYVEVATGSEFTFIVKHYEPDAIIYNYHPSTMSWLDNIIIDNLLPDVHHIGIYHEGEKTLAFDTNINLDPNNVEIRGVHYSIPRPLLNFSGLTRISYPRPVIGSFGFGFFNKGFQRLVRQVNKEFDEALIMLDIPFAHYGDINGDSAKLIAEACHTLITKPGIHLHISHEFVSEDILLHKLASNDINCFLYDDMPGRGISSVIDYALSVDTPIAISKSNMFRHIIDVQPSICIEDRSIKDIISSGTNPLQKYKDNWSHENFIKKYEYILNQTIG